MGYYRGVPNKMPNKTQADKRAELDRVASEMRQRNLTQGTGCTAQRRAIEKLLGIPATTAIDAADRIIREVQR